MGGYAIQLAFASSVAASCDDALVLMTTSSGTAPSRVDQRTASPTPSSRAEAAAASTSGDESVARTNSTRTDLPARVRRSSACPHALGRQGLTTSSSPRCATPNSDSIAARCIQAAEPVYQLQPPRPT